MYYTQGNYATRDSNGMCHLMPRQHLPVWREEDERAFVHYGSWKPNKGLDNTMPATVFTTSHYKVTENTFESFVADSVRCNSGV